MRVVVILLAAALAGCGTPQPPLAISGLEVTKPIPGRPMSAGYLVITNNTDQAVLITAVESPQFANVEIHETTMRDGIARMRELESLEVPANGNVVLARGGKHLMLMRPGDLGDSVTLRFLSEDTLLLSVDYTFPKDKG